MARPVPWLPEARWKRWLVLFGIGAFFLVRKFVLTVVVLVITAVLLWQNPRFQGWAMLKMMRGQMRQPSEPPPVPALSADEKSRLSTNAAALQSPSELYGATNVWDIRLAFTATQWTALGPNSVPPVVQFTQPDGSIILRNPNASRNGLAGVFGLDFPWSEAALEFGDLLFTNVAVRFKGNGTFVTSQRSYRRPFKLELSRTGRGRQVAGRAVFNLHNLTADGSCLSDTLAYEFFREAGVPASRTAFARLRLSVGGRFEDRLLGLYVMVENPDADWAREQFGVSGVALFKPVTYELFKDLGEDWKEYKGIYDPKTRTRAKQERRLIELAKLVSHAGDDEFAARVGDFIDLEEFAGFLAGEVILSNYDGILSNGQNFLLYLDPRTDRFGFIPWDLDHCWGEFGYVGSLAQREQASLWHPWIGQNRFLERMLAAAPVRERYRRAMEQLRATIFVPERLSRRLDELAAVVRPFLAEESRDRLSRFEHLVSEPPPREDPNGGKPAHPTYSLKRFFRERAISVTDQLEGRSEGLVPHRGH